MQKAFDKYIKDNGLTAEAVLAAYADKSVPNLSSIVCLVEMEGKTILLTGDARGDYILDGLKKAKILKNETMKVDVLKVPHHGSERNLEQGFFETIIADTYVFSADGKYGNPDRESLDWLIQARGKDAKYDIILTYPVRGYRQGAQGEKQEAVGSGEAFPRGLVRATRGGGIQVQSAGR